MQRGDAATHSGNAVGDGAFALRAVEPALGEGVGAVGARLQGLLQLALVRLPTSEARGKGRGGSGMDQAHLAADLISLHVHSAVARNTSR